MGDTTKFLNLGENQRISNFKMLLPSTHVYRRFPQKWGVLTQFEERIDLPSNSCSPPISAEIGDPGQRTHRFGLGTTATAGSQAFLYSFIRNHHFTSVRNVPRICEYADRIKHFRNTFTLPHSCEGTGRPGYDPARTILRSMRVKSS